MHKPGLFGMNGLMALFFICLSVVARAQQPGFAILIEAENKQAFIVRIGEQLFASTAQGHLVISQLKDSNYNICLRFPKNDLPEQIFPVAMHGNDQGFQLRKSDSVWLLFNWQNKETIRPTFEHDSTRILNKGIKREDGFSRLMAAVVNDSSVMYNTYTGTGFNQDSPAVKTQAVIVNKDQPSVSNPVSVSKQETTPLKQPPASNPVSVSKQETTPLKQPPASNPVSVSKQETTPLKQPPVVPVVVAPTVRTSKDSLFATKKPEPVKDSTGITKKATSSPDSSLKVNHQQPVVASGVKKLREVSLKISRKMVFQDIGKDGQKDTITLFVFFENEDTLVKKPNASTSVAGARMNKPVDTLGVKPQAPNKTVAKTTASSCIQIATDENVADVRSAILKANTEDEKIAAASDAFSSTCFSVSQIRLLASLFVSDKAKYRLMDAAHLHVTNPDHFRELVDMLTDKNFQRKFLTLADKRT